MSRLVRKQEVIDLTGIWTPEVVPEYPFIEEELEAEIWLETQDACLQTPLMWQGYIF